MIFQSFWYQSWSFFPQIFFENLESFVKVFFRHVLSFVHFIHHQRIVEKGQKDSKYCNKESNTRWVMMSHHDDVWWRLLLTEIQVFIKMLLKINPHYFLAYKIAINTCVLFLWNIFFSLIYLSFHHQALKSQSELLASFFFFLAWLGNSWSSTTFLASFFKAGLINFPMPLE